MCASTDPWERGELFVTSPAARVALIRFVSLLPSQMEFDEKELRREISYAIKNIHGIRHVWGGERGAGQS